MRKAPIPKDEDRRLESLHELQLLDNNNHDLFEGAAELAAEVFGASVALVSLIDADRQWFASKHNFDPDETERDISFCGHAIVGRSVMVVPDARLDSRFRDNPLVLLGTNPVVFYAGAPLVTPENLALGTLCVIDHEPKYPTERQVRALEHLARFVVDQMELRRAMLRKERAAVEAERNSRNLARRLNDVAQDIRTALSGMIGITDLLSKRATDPENEQNLATLKYSAMSLVHVTEQLSTHSVAQLKKSQLTLGATNPLAVAAAALSAFSAEAERRSVTTGISSDAGANVSLFTDQERLRLMLFHAAGFMIAQIEHGDLNLRLARGEREDTVAFLITASGEKTSSENIDLWQLALDHQAGPSDVPLTDSLFSIRDLCREIGGSVKINTDDNGLVLSLQLPVTLTLGRR